MSIELILTWIAIITLGNLIPGPDFMYVMSVSLRANRMHGFMAALGLQTGVLWNSLVGIAGIMLISISNLLPLMSVIGGLYISYIGWQICGTAVTSWWQQFRTKPATSSTVSNASHEHTVNNTEATVPSDNNDALTQTLYTTACPATALPSFISVYIKGLLCNSLNPKCALFMITVLPRFIDAQGSFSTLEQLLVLLGINLVVGLLIWTGLALFVHKVSQAFLSPSFRTRLEVVSGIILILLGMVLFMSIWW